MLKYWGEKREFSRSCWCQLSWVAFTTQDGSIFLTLVTLDCLKDFSILFCYCTLDWMSVWVLVCRCAS